MKMVDIVKQDKEVSLAYMKIFEREAMLIDQGKELGQALERENTRKAELRAKAAEQQAKAAEQQAEAAQQQAKVAQQQLKRSIIEFLQEYTTVPQWVEDKIMSESSMDTLSSWLKISVKSQSIEDFVKRANLLR